MPLFKKAGAVKKQFILKAFYIIINYQKLRRNI